jgi:hypothetical protein
VIVRSKWGLNLSCEADLSSKETKQPLDGNPKTFNRNGMHCHMGELVTHLAKLVTLHHTETSRLTRMVSVLLNRIEKINQKSRMEL